MSAPGEPVVAEELDVLSRVAELPVDVDVEAMAVIANVWRAAQEVRAQLERRVLRPEGVSWGGFSLLFNLWISGPDHPMETRALAASIGCARPSVSSLCDTLERDGLITRRGDAQDRRLVRVALTSTGRRLIEELFPRFNSGETQLVGGLSEEDRRLLAILLRRLLHSVRSGEPAVAPS
ncbi:MAG TPA: MarR family transcriptional regulator [Solirubrobacteraceae bacterium]|nr:MarR family transcriptional regulator [Solirubrobacteraceae bacterium]